MRSLRRLALLAPALFLLPIACEDSSSSSGGTFTQEAGPGFEAGPTTTPDAGPLPDGALPDTFVPPSGVTVTVLDGATPKMGVRVISHDAAGLVTGQAATDATGKVKLATAPSMVTVLSTRGTEPAAVTFAGVTDGDNLRVVGPATLAAAGAYDVTFVAGDPLITNANIFSVQGPSAGASTCAGEGSAPDATIHVPLFADCLAAKNSLLTTASNLGGLIGFGFKKDLTPPAGMSTVAVSLPAFTAPGTTTVKASNLPGGTVDTSLLAIANGQAKTLPGSTGGVLDGAGLDFPTPTAFAEAYQTAISAGASSALRTLVRRAATTAPASTTLPTIDFATALPIISNANVAAPTPARPDITVVTAAPAALATADAGVLRISWFLPAVDGSVSWTFVVPPSTTTFKVPALPADAPDFTPTTDTFRVTDVTFFDASQLPSYQAAKALPVAPGFGLDFIDSTRPLPSDGTLRISHVTPFLP